MSAAAQGTGTATARDEIWALLVTEARLADEHRYADWLALWDDDAVYWVPCNVDDPDPETSVSVIYDDRARLEHRIQRLQSGNVPAQTPPSRMHRLLSNLELDGDGDGEYLARVNFLLPEWRLGQTTLWAGRMTYRLRRRDGGLRIAMKKVVLVNNDEPLPPLAFLI